MDQKQRSTECAYCGQAAAGEMLQAYGSCWVCARCREEPPTPGRRIYFETWGAGSFETPAYAVHQADGYSTPLSAVATAIARKNRMECCAGPQSQGTALDRAGDPEADHYSMTLGRRCPGGGYTPAHEVWFSIPRR